MQKRILKLCSVVLSLAATVFVMSLIYGFSAQNAEASGSLSAEVTREVLRVTDRDFSKKTQEQQAAEIAKLHPFIRKAAHFSEFCALGFFCLWHLQSLYTLRGKKRDGKYLLRLPAAAWLFSALYAGADEFHQSFSDGRAPSLVDVAIDSSGALFGILFSCAIRMIVHALARRKNRLAASSSGQDALA